ncbi:MAG: hypothetical protein IPM47_14865 [Sphingobacteriales bacterium]|nr:MAG: hypothetical protein IPM47_14835 [Sphingobacteriales bacterium]QQS28139.1 MAG: hypothetical protein IPM47_14865 [Sphingobacteriales bacterium]
MKYLLFFYLLCCLFACTHKTYKYIVDYDSEPNRYNYCIPNGFQFYGWSGGHEDERQYWFADSSVFYITKTKELPNINSENIKSIQGFYAKLLLSDSIGLEGVDKNNLYWKHVKLEGFSYGYSNVTSRDLEKFNQIILSVKRKK